MLKSWLILLKYRLNQFKYWLKYLKYWLKIFIYKLKYPKFWLIRVQRGQSKASGRLTRAAATPPRELASLSRRIAAG